MDKETCRLQMKEQLALMTQSELEEKSKCLSSNLLSYLQTIDFNSICLGVFSPIQKEPLWFLEVLSLTDFNYSIVQVEDEETIGFYRVNSLDVAKSLPLSVKESGLKDKVKPNIVLVPGLAFSKNLGRLGRGGGYFDRYLEKFGGQKVGLCFESQLLETLPIEEHDVLMNKIITDKKIY